MARVGANVETPVAGELTFISGTSVGYSPAAPGAAQLDAGVTDSVSDRLRLRVQNGRLLVSTVSQWTGQLTFSFRVADGADSTLVSLTVTATPPKPKAVVYSPASKDWSMVAWKGSTAAAEGYNVYIGGKQFCHTHSESCLVAKLLGPRNKVRVMALGNDGTHSWLSDTGKAGITGNNALATIFFNEDEAILRTRARVALDRLADFLKSAGVKQVTLYGYSDNLRGERNAKAFSTWRNESVMHYLERRVPRLTVTMRAMGSTKPKASNATAAGRALNRRVVVVLGTR